MPRSSPQEQGVQQHAPFITHSDLRTYRAATVHVACNSASDTLRLAVLGGYRRGRRRGWPVAKNSEDVSLRDEVDKLVRRVGDDRDLSDDASLPAKDDVRNEAVDAEEIGLTTTIVAEATKLLIAFIAHQKRAGRAGNGSADELFRLAGASGISAKALGNARKRLAVLLPLPLPPRTSEVERFEPVAAVKTHEGYGQPRMGIVGDAFELKYDNDADIDDDDFEDHDRRSDSSNQGVSLRKRMLNAVKVEGFLQPSSSSSEDE